MTTETKEKAVEMMLKIRSMLMRLEVLMLKEDHLNFQFYNVAQTVHELSDQIRKTQTDDDRKQLELEMGNLE